MWVTLPFPGQGPQGPQTLLQQIRPYHTLFFKNFFFFFLAFRIHANGVFGHQNRRFLKTLDCRFVHVDERWYHTSYRGSLSFLRFFKMDENNLSTLIMDTYFLENGVKISEQQKEARLICQLGVYIYFLLTLRKAGFRVLQMTGKISVFPNIWIRVDEASKLSWLHHWLSCTVSTTDIFGRKEANSIWVRASQ